MDNHPLMAQSYHNKICQQFQHIKAKGQRKTSHARKLFQKAFPAAASSNRFSALEDMHPNHEDKNQKQKEIQVTTFPSQIEDQSTQESEYSENDKSEDESMDAMSLVSSTEIQGLVADQYAFKDNGYNTETTDNTSPSHKRKKPSCKSSATAQERMSDFYSTPDSFDTCKGTELDYNSQQLC